MNESGDRLILYTFSTIEDLLDAGKSEGVRFVGAGDTIDSSGIAGACCALANRGGGKLIFGISDERPRKVVGSKAFEQPERTRDELIDKLKTTVDFQLYDCQGKRVLVFDVASHPLGLPVQSDGIAWWYEGDSLIPMPENIRRRIYAEAGFDFSESICPEAGIYDLDESAIEKFRNRWASRSGNQRIQALSTEQLLRDCNAITESGVTYAALIMFGRRESLVKFLPQAEIIFEYRSTEAAGPANQREEFRTAFFNCFDRLWELINLRNDKQHYEDKFIVYDIPTFNEQAVREAILNAVSHRNYQMSGSVFIRQYHNRLVIESPGGFPNGISLENILDRQMPRNRRIAELMALSGLVERSGQGMNLIYELCVKEAKPLPDFTGTDENFVNITLHGLIRDKKIFSVLNRIDSKTMASFSTCDYLTINALCREQNITNGMKASIQKLVALGIAERISRNKYALAGNLFAIAGKTDVYKRTTRMDRNACKDLLLRYIFENGTEGASLKELQEVLSGYTRSETQVLIRELRAEGKIYCKGRTSAARWFLTEKN